MERRPVCGLRQLAAVLLIAGTSVAAQAADFATSSPPEAVSLDDRVRAFDHAVEQAKRRALDQAFAARAAAADFVPEGPSVAIYLSLAGKRELVPARGASIQFSIDGEPASIVALAASTVVPGSTDAPRLQRLTRLRLSPGAHHLKAIVTISPEASPNAQPDAALGSVPIEREFQIGSDETAIELRLERAPNGDGPTLAMTEWRSDVPKAGFIERLTQQAASASPPLARYKPGADSDLAVRYIQSLVDNRQTFMAALAAREYTVRWSRTLETGSANEVALRSLQLQTLLALGLLNDDEVRTLAKPALTPDALLDLAAAQRLHDDPSAALASLSRLPSALSPVQRQRASELRALALMAQQKFESAASVLATIQPDPVKQLSDGCDAQTCGRVWQYDLGIALMRSGRVDQGRGVLDRLGLAQARDAQSLALRDKANLTLGWSFLRDAQGASARPVLERVRLEGPFSNRALLGLGWAELAPQGQRQRRADPGADSTAARDTPKFVLNVLERRKLIDCEEYNRRAVAPPNQCIPGGRFERGSVPSDPKQLTAAALIPWRTLVEQSPDDAEAFEARNAMAYAYGLLGDRAQTRSALEAAIAADEAAIQHLDAAIEMLKRDGLPALSAPNETAEPALRASLEDLVASLPHPERSSLLETDRFTNVLSLGLDLLWLDSHSNDSVASLLADQRRLLADLAVAALDEHRARLAIYLEAARAGLARAYDPALIDTAPAPELR